MNNTNVVIVSSSIYNCRCQLVTLSCHLLLSIICFRCYVRFFSSKLSLLMIIIVVFLSCCRSGKFENVAGSAIFSKIPHKFVTLSLFPPSVTPLPPVPRASIILSIFSVNFPLVVLYVQASVFWTFSFQILRYDGIFSARHDLLAFFFFFFFFKF